MVGLGLALFLCAGWSPGPAAAGTPDLRRAQADLQQQVFGQAVVAEARKQLGRPYVWGGSSPKGFDCAGYTRYVFARLGVRLPLRAIQQFDSGVEIEQDALLPGDLVFFASSSPEASLHVGIYEGRGVFMHAPGSRSVIKRSRLDSAYFAARFMGARRLAPSKHP